MLAWEDVPLGGVLDTSRGELTFGPFLVGRACLRA
jgi:hypothetical protein